MNIPETIREQCFKNMKKLHVVSHKSRCLRHSERGWVLIGEALEGFMEVGVLWLGLKKARGGSVLAESQHQ